MRAPTEREKLGVMLIAMGVTRLLLGIFSSKRDPVVEYMEERHAAYRHRYGADNPGAN